MKNRIKLLLKGSKLFMWGYKNVFIWGYKKYQNRTRLIYINNKKLFKDKSGIEIAGLSPVFSEKGPVPLYKIIKQLDNINYSGKTFWGNFDEGENFQFNINKQKGRQFIADTTDLSIIADNSYDFLISSHVIEHIADPIKALNEWKRVVKPAGFLLIIAPNMNFTYDRNRLLTKLDHIINDFKNHTNESDSTHFEEVIKMHDLSNDSTVNSYEEHVKRTLDNLNTRIVHHHTFNMKLLIKLLEYCDFKIISNQSVRPYHLIVIAQKV